MKQERTKMSISKIQNAFCFWYILTLARINFHTLATCEFNQYHNQILVNSDPVQSRLVRGGSQCDLLCSQYDGLCSGVNLVYDNQRASFVCELFDYMPCVMTSGVLRDHAGGKFAVKKHLKG